MLFTVLYTTCSLAIPWNMIQNRDVSYQSINAVQCPVSICAFICYIFLNKECQRNKDFILKNKSERSNSSFILIFLHQAFVIWNIFILQALERNVFFNFSNDLCWICRIFRTYCTLLSNCCVLCHITSTAMHVLYPRMGVSSKRYRSELWNNILLASPIFHRYNHWLLILVEPSTKSSYEKPTVSGSEADSEGILDLEKNITIN